jgi:16S rRNA (guanine(966)-N(2))-methyltransferase RsmD
VIGGAAKGRRLKMVHSTTTRPIPDRVKEALFNIISRDVEESVFLDLFAGTGSVGIEALSRGAQLAVFIELHRDALQTIRENLQSTGLHTSAKVVQADVFAWLLSDTETQFDYVYIAPPQYKGFWVKALKTIDKNPEILNPDAWVIAQIDPKEYVDIELQSLMEFDRRKYGRTMLLFYELLEINPSEERGKPSTYLLS